MRLYLIDTSAWIRHFNKRDAFDLRDICPPEQRVLCLPVYQEILQGIREEAVFRNMKGILDSAIFIEDPLGRSLFLEAAELYRAARRQGLTVRSSIDCIIAACGIRHNLPVVHHDRDYTALARVSQLREIAV
jgi:predicted nucleic acid-binding protein